ncbi:unnamed protein product, partial [Ixodes pacificus]
MSVHCILFVFFSPYFFILCFVFMYRFSTLFISNLVLFLWAWATLERPRFFQVSLFFFSCRLFPFFALFVMLKEPDLNLPRAVCNVTSSRKEGFRFQCRLIDGHSSRGRSK